MRLRAKGARQCWCSAWLLPDPACGAPRWPAAGQFPVGQTSALYALARAFSRQRSHVHRHPACTLVRMNGPALLRGVMWSTCMSRQSLARSMPSYTSDSKRSATSLKEQWSVEEVAESLCRSV